MGCANSKEAPPAEGDAPAVQRTDSERDFEARLAAVVAARHRAVCDDASSLATPPATAPLPAGTPAKKSLKKTKRTPPASDSDGFPASMGSSETQIPAGLRFVPLPLSPNDSVTGCNNPLLVLSDVPEDRTVGTDSEVLASTQSFEFGGLSLTEDGRPRPAAPAPRQASPDGARFTPAKTATPTQTTGSTERRPMATPARDDVPMGSDASLDRLVTDSANASPFASVNSVARDLPLGALPSLPV